jgi:hypothetical protein
MEGRKSLTVNLNNKCVSSKRTGWPKWWPPYAAELELFPNNNKTVCIMRAHLLNTMSRLVIQLSNDSCTVSFHN